MTDTGTVICWPHSRSAWESIIGTAVSSDSVRWANPFYYVSSDAVKALISTPLPYIVLPLSLPNFASLRVAEYCHRLKSATRTILISDTNCPTRTLKRLFDHHLSNSQLTVAALHDAFIGNVVRKTDGEQITEAITAILGKASCFTTFQLGTMLHQHARIVDYEDYANPTSHVTFPDLEALLQELTRLSPLLIKNADHPAIRDRLNELLSAISDPVKDIAQNPDKIQKLLAYGRWASETVQKIGIEFTSNLLSWLSGIK